MMNQKFGLSSLRGEVLFALTMVVILFFNFWDIGNSEAIRQGTEGQYLQISAEMFSKSSFITPFYEDQIHWSKPPLHFWLPMPLYYFFNGPSLLLARMCVGILSILGLLYISTWIKKHFNLPLFLSCLFIASSIGIFKYSRTYMMEIPLTILSTIAALKFFDYLENKQKPDLFLATIILSLSILVKGPISLVMCLGGAGLFLLMDSSFGRFVVFKRLVLWATFSTLLGSIWFVLAYWKHGSVVWESFFLRENLGKFMAGPYPVDKLLYGLLIYALPWSLLLPIALRNFFKNYHTLKNPALTFLLSNFIFFFFIWFLPSQRSHHYAIPSIIFFLSLILIFYSSKQPRDAVIRNRTQYLIDLVISLFVMTLMVALIASMFMDNIYSSRNSVLVILLVLPACLFCLISHIARTSLYTRALSFFLMLGTLWTVLLPMFYLPIVNQKTVNLIGNKEISLVFRKPYFVEQAISKDVWHIDPANINQHIIEHQKVADQRYYIVPKSIYFRQNLEKLTNIISEWPVWRRGITFSDVWSAWSTKSVRDLQENLLLLKSYSSSGPN